jgi:hypothetical protein
MTCPGTGVNIPVNRDRGVEAMSLKNVWLITTAVNMLVATPMNKVIENPVTAEAPKRDPNQNRMTQVIIVATLLLRIAGQALL